MVAGQARGSDDLHLGPGHRVHVRQVRVVDAGARTVGGTGSNAARRRPVRERSTRHRRSALGWMPVLSTALIVDGGGASRCRPADRHRCWVLEARVAADKANAAGRLEAHLVLDPSSRRAVGPLRRPSAWISSAVIFRNWSVVSAPLACVVPTPPADQRLLLSLQAMTASGGLTCSTSGARLLLQLRRVRRDRAAGHERRPSPAGPPTALSAPAPNGAPLTTCATGR